MKKYGYDEKGNGKINPLVKKPSTGGKGRPFKPRRICDSEVFKLARNFLPEKDICTLLNISPDHLKESYQGVIDRAHADTRAKLLEVLKNMSFILKNERITIWLSKIWLGYQETTADTQPSTVINIKVNEIPTETTIEAHSSHSRPDEGKEMERKAIVDSRGVSEGLKGNVVQENRGKEGG